MRTASYTVGFKRLFLLVLILTVALTTTATAAAKFPKKTKVEFNKNAVVYEKHNEKSKTDVIIHKGSISVVKRSYGSNWVELYLDRADTTKTAWLKVSALKKTDKKISVQGKWKTDIFIGYTNNIDDSNSYLGPFDDAGTAFQRGGFRISPDKFKHVKFTKDRVLLYNSPSLKTVFREFSYEKGTKEKYLRKWVLNKSLVTVYNIKYHGRNLWISSEDCKLVQ